MGVVTLGGVAGRTDGGRLADVGLVTPDAALVPGRSALLLRRVAAPASHLGGRRSVGRRQTMAGATAAPGVPGVARDQRRLACVAALAKAPHLEPGEVVGFVAGGARNASGVGTVIAAGHEVMAARARNRHGEGVARVRCMAAHARARVAVFDPDVLVAPGARRRRLHRGVRRVAVQTELMCGDHGRGERGLVPVAIDAPGLGGLECVRSVTAHAGVVRGGVGLLRLRVAGSARDGGLLGALVPHVAVEAPLRADVPSVLGRPLVVAARAGGRDEGRVGGAALDLMARRAGGLRVHGDRGEATLVALVAADARARRFARSEGMAPETAAGAGARGRMVRGGQSRSVALRADRDPRVSKSLALEVVAVVALDLAVADVRLVARTRPELRPRRWHEIGRHRGRPLRAQKAHPEQGESGHRKHDDQRGRGHPPAVRTPSREKGHGPTPWQSRQGRSWCTALLLWKPGP